MQHNSCRISNRVLSVCLYVCDFHKNLNISKTVYDTVIELCCTCYLCKGKISYTFQFCTNCSFRIGGRLKLLVNISAGILGNHLIGEYILRQREMALHILYFWETYCQSITYRKCPSRAATIWRSMMERFLICLLGLEDIDRMYEDRLLGRGGPVH